MSPEEQADALAWPEIRDIPIFPADSRNKRIFMYGWQKMDFTNYDFRSKLEAGEYDNGIAIRTGRTITGKNAAYSIAIDFDGWDALEEWFGNWERVESLSQKTLIEWHKNRSKIHVLLFSKEAISNRKIQIKDSLLEIRCEHQALFVSPSYHREGNQYEPLGTTEIAIMDEKQVFNLKAKIESLCRGYMLNENKNEYTKWLEDPANYSKLGIGQGRHNALVHLGTAYFYRWKGEWTNLRDSQRKAKLEEWNSKLAVPKPQEEVNKVWRWIVDHHKSIRDEERQKHAQEEKKRDDDQIIADATEAILGMYNFVTIEENDTIYYYENGRYIAGGEVLIKEACWNLYGYELNIRMRSEIQEYIKSRSYHKLSEFDTDLNIINLDNGLYDIRSDTLKPHTHEYLSMNQIPVSYVSGAKPKLFGKFLSEVLYPGEIKTTVELMAYTFHRDNPFEVIVILQGDGSNGKSIVFGILTALHGPHNVSNVSLKTLMERPFGLFDLLGKNCNLDAELSSGKIEDTAILKKVTGRELIRVEQKNQKAFDARIYAKIWLSANTIPDSSDQTDAWFRRNVIIAFPNKFDINEDLERGIQRLDPNLIYKLTTPEELSGIFNVMMNALRRIIKNKAISIPQRTIEQRRIRYEMAVDPIRGFLDEAIDEDSDDDDTTTKDVMYAAYLEFCKTYKLNGGTKDAFSKLMKKRHKEDKSIRHEKKVYRVWIGMKLTEQYLDTKLVKAAFAKVHEDGLQSSLGI